MGFLVTKQLAHCIYVAVLVVGAVPQITVKGFKQFTQFVILGAWMVSLLDTTYNIF